MKYWCGWAEKRPFFGGGDEDYECNFSFLLHSFISKFKKSNNNVLNRKFPAAMRPNTTGSFITQKRRSD